MTVTVFENVVKHGLQCLINYFMCQRYIHQEFMLYQSSVGSIMLLENSLSISSPLI